MDRDDALWLSRMRDYAGEATALLSGRDRADLDTNRLLQLAIAELLHTIAQAASHVTESGRTDHPAIPWREIAAFRDRVQDYGFRIDNDFVWRTARYDLPVLIAHLKGTSAADR